MIKPWRFCAVVLSASAAFSLAADESPAPVPDVEIHGPNVRPEQNYAATQYNLGFCYAHGDGVTEDLVEAYKWLLLAARQGDEHPKEGVTLLENALRPKQIAAGQSGRAILSRGRRGCYYAYCFFACCSEESCLRSASI